MRCADPRLLLDLPDEILDAWIWFFNRREEEQRAIRDRILAEGGPAAAQAVLASLLE